MSKRRASGEGSIRKRSDGRWEGRYVAGHDEAGKPIRRNVLGKTQAEVKEKLKAALEEAGKVDVARAEEYTVGAWAMNWYKLYAEPNIRESTQETGTHQSLHGGGGEARRPAHVLPGTLLRPAERGTGGAPLE